MISKKGSMSNLVGSELSNYACMVNFARQSNNDQMGVQLKDALHVDSTK
ncbi:MAG: hypothetical protein ACK5IJ_02740 [Mangrovibacterium sp.]